MIRRRGWLVVLCLPLLSLMLETHAQEKKAGPKLPAGVKALRDLEYIPNGHARQKLDLYLPQKAEGRLPVVVWIHGGAWMAGNKDSCPALPFVGFGYAVASINYRLSQHAKFPAQIEDCKTAIRWLRANADKYHLDADHIGVWGASAGGHLVALLGTTGGVKELEGKEGNLAESSKVQAVCDWFGPTDFLKIAEQALPGSRLNHNAPDAPEAKLIGGAVLENKDKAERANPIKYVSKDDPPFLIMHGNRDDVVPPGQSELLAVALKKAGVPVELRIIDGAGHGGPAFGSNENRKRIMEFFDKHLKKRDDK